MDKTAQERLIAALREHALVIGDVTLTSGRKASTTWTRSGPSCSRTVLARWVSWWPGEADRLGATAVGGMTMGADPVACAALAAGAPVKAFFVRKEKKEHGLQRWIEGPELANGERCLVVEDVVTTGGSTVKAVERIREEGLEIAGVVSVLDRLAGGAEAIQAASDGAPYTPLTTIDDVYPDRPDR